MCHLGYEWFTNRWGRDGGHESISIRREDPFPLDEKFKAFGWHVLYANGHDYDQLQAAYAKARTLKGKPTMIIAKTVKGKGVSFMENDYMWHGVAPSPEQAEAALKELED